MRTTRRELLGASGALAVSGSAMGRALAATAAAPIVSKIALADGRVWMAAMIEKHGPYLFVVDTGGTVSLIDDGLARSLKLKTDGRSRLQGVGGISEMPWYKAGDVLLGNGIRFPDMMFAGTRANLGKDAAGTFGAGLFTTYDSDLDFEKGEWRAYVDGRPDRDGLRAVKSRFSSSQTGGLRIFADATIGGFAGEFTVDTGAPGEISLDSRATAKSGFWSDDRPYAPVRSRGIGKGSIPSRLIRLDRLKLGPFVFERPLLMLREPGNASGSSFDTDGLIGLRTLARLHLSTDVRSRILWAAPNKLALPPNGYGLSGLWVEEDKGGLLVADVGTASPAAVAGLKPGDLILGEAFAPFISRLGGPAGTTLAFDYERNGKRARAEFRLSEYL